ncbi:hypothetical protein [Succinivibrio dextrinosolvens]|uniref:Uncharacterized protein n=1 Tax=Succinivibrio dextrinosolvens TaxID=83771 RepID=A0A662Z6H6_9GAMM|nr:hypothetical protein [Succinivibrio dextrinosolvens]SFJ81106.1 hypothetical protein SAMN04487865_10039 [Succinivibrio dextrinosolvens]
MNKEKDLVFIFGLFKQRNRLIAEEKRQKAMQDLKEATEPFRKHPIATTMGILWLCVFIYAVSSVWQEEWIIIAFVAGFWLMVLFMGIGYCETLYGRDATYLHKTMTEINVFLIADVIPLDEDKTAQQFIR